MTVNATQITPSTNVYLNALQWGGWKWVDLDPNTPGTNLNYFVLPAGIPLNNITGQNQGPNSTSLEWSQAGLDTLAAALQTWADVANITFTQVFDYNQADLVEGLFLGQDETFFNPNTNKIEGTDWTTVLGVHEGPDNAFNGTGVDQGTAWGAYTVNDDNGLDTLEGLQPGARGFNTLVHELGHALGLSHPHDNGGNSGLFPGITPGDGASGDSGDFGLNQGIFTVMSYVDGWKTVLGQPDELYGQSSGPMAFDIAAIQYLYGAKAHNTGNNTYVLRHVDGQPDDLVCIWDTGGVDQIVYGGVFDAIIDLRAATLKHEPGGGGFVSYADGAPADFADHWNAFTIAHGVVIENAIGGSGADILIGNQANNKLVGLAGRDILFGGRGKDQLDGGSSRDLFDFNSIKESVRGSDRDKIIHFQRGTDDIDLKGIDAKTSVSGNNAFKWIGKQDFHDKKGELHYIDKGSTVIVQGDVNGDGKADFEIYVKVGALGSGDFLL